VKKSEGLTVVNSKIYLLAVCLLSLSPKGV